jgi:hypothetical protein
MGQTPVRPVWSGTASQEVWMTVDLINAGSGKDHVREFISFCRKGGFMIY